MKWMSELEDCQNRRNCQNLVIEKPFYSGLERSKKIEGKSPTARRTRSIRSIHIPNEEKDYSGSE
jgi:hypothetical protein